MWNDNESLTDFIDYGYLIKAVTTIIDKDELLPCSIGIFGDWGSGKSSLMKMIETRYAGDNKILLIRFNGWLFEGYEDAKSVLMGRIVDDIITKRTLSEKAIKYAAKLLKRIDWIKVASSSLKYGLSFLTMGPIGAAGVGLSDIAKELKDVDYEKYITEKKKNKVDDDDALRTNIQDFHENFEKLIKETKLAKIIVFIDDLDRCSTDTIIGTLEAIKLFLFTKNTAFIIGADERLIKYAVRRRFPEVPGDNIEIGRDYLEKLIQYPIRIPPLNKLELTTYINLLFSQMYSDTESEFEEGRTKVISSKSKKGFEFSLDQSNISEFFNLKKPEFEDGIALCSQIVPVLSIGLNGNPRQTKRFLNTLLLRIDMALERGIPLKKRVLAKLMLLEYFKPETFTDFHAIQAANNGEIPIIGRLENILDIHNPKVIQDRNGEVDTESKDNEKQDSSSIKLTAEERILIEDEWMKDWIQSEPKLGGKNLQEYFFFSRDKLMLSTVNYQRMTAKAQDVMRHLLSPTKSIQEAGKSAIKSLSLAETASIFEALTQKVRQEENLTNSPAFKSLFELCTNNIELKSQIFTFLLKFPDYKLPLITPTLSESLLKVTHPEALKQLFEKWQKSPNQKLANLIKQKLK